MNRKNDGTQTGTLAELRMLLSYLSRTWASFIWTW